MASLTDQAVDILSTADPEAKASKTLKAAAAWQRGEIAEVGATTPPARPARPPRPVLKPPRDMPRRRSGSQVGLIALLHALAHIELNAIDLAWDAVARFTGEDLPRAYYDDWVGVAADESRHFTLLQACLAARDAGYGDLPAHDGLWEAAEITTDDLAARLALVPMLLEARALDVTPATVQRLERQGADDVARALDQIYREEVDHVAAGCRWFEYMCQRRGEAPVDAFAGFVRSRFRGQIKPPFNEIARNAAGMAAAYYQQFAAK